MYVDLLTNPIALSNSFKVSLSTDTDIVIDVMYDSVCIIVIYSYSVIMFLLLIHSFI